MNDDLYVGMTLYHRMDKTRATISSITQNEIVIKLSKEIASKTSLSLPITHIGEWLFFEEDDISQDPYILAENNRYSIYKNSMLIEAKRAHDAELLRLAEEEKRKHQEYEERKQYEIDNEIVLMKKREAIRSQKQTLIDNLKSNYSFEGFHHYTDFMNFIRIMNYGYILSREEASKIGFQDAAERDLIKRTQDLVKKHVRFFYKDRTPTLYANEGIKIDNKAPHMPMPVLMIFDEYIIYNDDVVFSNGCAGSKYSIKTTRVEDAMKFDWKTIFSRGPIPMDACDLNSLGYAPEKSRIVLNRNAEFLCYQKVGIEKIKKVCFRCQADMKHAVSIIGENSLFEVVPQKFNNHKNYLKDYRMICQSNMYKFKMVYNQPHKGYVHELSVYYADGEIDQTKIGGRNRKVSIRTTDKTDELLFFYKARENSVVTRIEYSLNGHICALWKV